MAQKQQEKEQERPPQHQDRQPGVESEMEPRPESFDAGYQASGKLSDRVAIVTGGDSGIGRAVALAFAAEGADVAIVYLEEHGDAEETREGIEERDRQCLLLPGDVGDRAFCREAVERVIAELGRLEILVNNAAVQFPSERLEDISAEQLEKTFRTNLFSQFWVTQSALEHMREGAAIINSTSVTAYRGSPHLIDYAATKGGIVAFTRSLALALVERGIRVNAVAPGPIWTPLIPASFPAEQVATFGSEVPMGRAGEPEEVAPAYVYLASDDASYVTGQVLHVNGGEIVNG